MGILSEMDMMNRDAEDDAFEVSSDSETVDSFSEEFEPVEPPKPEPQAEDAEEARKKAEFDAAEAKRKAEWEAKQAQKKLREQPKENGDPVHWIAPPGASEHQTGLALDVSCQAVDYQLDERFGETREGRWLRRCAPLYGFILRYPKGKEHITGYGWEPWHIRYVTRSLALYLTLTGLTLEEYYEQK